MNKGILKSIVAILAGFVTVLILSVGTDFVLEKLGAFPPQADSSAYRWWMLLVALLYRSLYGGVGGYVAAMLAPRLPMRHAIILGIAGLVFAILGSAANWDKVTASTAWYPVLLIILTLPSVWLGGKMRTKKSQPIIKNNLTREWPS